MWDDKKLRIPPDRLTALSGDDADEAPSDSLAKTFEGEKLTMLKGLIGKKIGMTQIFDDQGVAYPVTLIEAGPCYVTQIRKPEKEGYSAVQLGFAEVHPKRLTQRRAWASQCQ